MRHDPEWVMILSLLSCISTIPTPRDRAMSSCRTLFLSRHFMDIFMKCDWWWVTILWWTLYISTLPHLETEWRHHMFLWRFRADFAPFSWNGAINFALIINETCVTKSQDVVINMVHLDHPSHLETEPLQISRHFLDMIHDESQEIVINIIHLDHPHP